MDNSGQQTSLLSSNPATV
jgi:hypothetical protein